MGIISSFFLSCIFLNLFLSPSVISSILPSSSSSSSISTSLSRNRSTDDFDTVRQRLLSLLCYASVNSLPSVVNDALIFSDRLLPNNTWADINYTDYMDRTIWNTSNHLSRVMMMTQAVSDPRSPQYGNASLVNSTRRAYSYWYTTDPQNLNWWFDIIFVPQLFGCITLMLGELPSSFNFPNPIEANKSLEFTYRAAWWNSSLGYETTGANLDWMMQAQLTRGCFRYNENVTALQQGFTRLWEEAKIVNRSMDYNDAQGIQHDYSYFFHGPQLQIGSYGQDYTQDMILFIELAQGTNWSIPLPQLSIFCDYLGQGQAWLSIGAAYEFTGVGRQLSRPGLNSEYGITINTTRLEIISTSCPLPEQQQNILNFVNRINNATDTPPIIGSRHFYCADTSIHRREQYMAVFYGHSTRTFQPECGNGEDLKGVWLGEGLYYVYSAVCGTGTDGQPLGCGEEYANIFPLWNWNLVPGTFSLLDYPYNCSYQCCWYHTGSNQSFVGGVSDGTYTVSGMDTVVRGLSAHRAWFMFDDALVALTANASYTGMYHPVTSIDQRWAHNPHIMAGFSNGTIVALPTGNYTFDDNLPVSWLQVNSIGWIPLGNTVAVPKLDFGMREGNWDTIGPSNLVATGQTMMLYLDHGQGSLPSNSSWGYIIIPNATLESMDYQARTNGGITIVQNNANVQAVANVNDKILHAVFWPSSDTCPSYQRIPNSPSGQCTGGQLSFTDPSFSIHFNVSHPCFVLYRENSTTATIAVANPDTPDGLVITLTVFDRSFTSSTDCVAEPGPVNGSTVLTMTLPGNPLIDLGQSIVQTCSIVQNI